VSDTIITVENLSKKYLVGHQTGPRGRSRYVALRDVIGREVRTLARKTIDMAHGRQLLQGDDVEEFWALKDVSFAVKRGEVLGIIGHNGAGKSTLLKVLSRITEPTEGRITLRGRVASLLEVGTGFHPELTGRENIYLNGAILGMTRREIIARFEEIVAFAEVEKFLDTPVKHYSTGMYVRLAFAVAAHLDAEILIVDEVLAVGDSEFQRKCLSKMHDFASVNDRTVLFVSHNMAAVQKLCHSALLLVAGRSVLTGPVEAVIQRYLSEISRSEEVLLRNRRDRQGSGKIRFITVSLEDRAGEKISAFRCGANAILCLHIDVLSTTTLQSVDLSVGIDNQFGQRVALLDSEMIGANIPAFVPGRHRVRFIIPRMPLIPGRYRLTLFASIGGEPADWIKDACTLDVEAGDFFGTGRLGGAESGQGLVLIEHEIAVSDKNPMVSEISSAIN
jgi:lipopolysaccharide transport system ATP-binding protein